MPEFRKDPIVGRWVIIAHEQAKRPHDFKAEAVPRRKGQTARSARDRKTRLRPRSSPTVSSAAVPTAPAGGSESFPTAFHLQVEGDLNERGDGIYDMMAGVRAHEVIIESNQHHVSMAPLSEENIREVLWVYRDRLVDLRRTSGCRARHALQERRRGRGSAALSTPHSQLIVTPIVPISVWEEMTGALEFFNYRGRCIYCDMIQQELSVEKRIVLDSTHFTAFCPYASRFPFETWIVPKTHASHFENIPKPGVDDLGPCLASGAQQA